MTTKTELLAVIRKRCLECCSGSYAEVERCTSGPNASPYATCALWEFRLGIDPYPSETRVQSGRKLGGIKREGIPSML